MKTRYTVALSMIAGATLGAAVDFVPGSVVAQPMDKKGTTPYVTHFIFRPLMSIDIPGLGTATNLDRADAGAKSIRYSRSAAPVP
jgi:hypothetical protein